MSLNVREALPASDVGMTRILPLKPRYGQRVSAFPRRPLGAAPVPVLPTPDCQTSTACRCRTEMPSDALAGRRGEEIFQRLVRLNGPSPSPLAGGAEVDRSCIPTAAPGLRTRGCPQAWGCLAPSASGGAGRYWVSHGWSTTAVSGVSASSLGKRSWQSLTQPEAAEPTNKSRGVQGCGGPAPLRPRPGLSRESVAPALRNENRFRHEIRLAGHAPLASNPGSSCWR